MDDLKKFAKGIAKLGTTHVERATALLWYFKQSQMFEDRSVSELVQDLHDLGFPRPNVTLLRKQLGRSKSVTRGKRKKTFQIDLRKMDELTKEYSPLVDLPTQEVSDAVVPKAMVAGTRLYLERLVHQINGSYDAGFYDACAVLCRRLMESLIIECFIANGLKSTIENNGNFVFLENLIKALKNEKSFNLGRNSPSTIDTIKQIGDTAAHDRTHLTQKQDIDDVKVEYRALLSALLTTAKIK